MPQVAKRKSNAAKSKRTPRKGAVLLSFSDFSKDKQMSKQATKLKFYSDSVPNVISKTIRYEHLKKFEPLTYAQERTFQEYQNGNNLLLTGSAGTGKTFLALYLAMKEILLRETDFERILVVRSVVPVRDIGHLPGTKEEKEAVYELPYKAIFNEIFHQSEHLIEKLKEQGLYSFISTSNIRGITLHNTIVIADEYSNMSAHELDSIITRLGENCKIIFSGDMSQSDLSKTSEKQEINKFTRILDAMSSFRRIEFHNEDIVRSGLVKEYLITKQSLE